MSRALAVTLGLAVAAICGRALWPTPAAAAAAPPPLPAPRPASAGPGTEPAFATVLLALLTPAQRQQASLGATAPADLLFGRSVPPAALAGRRGITAASLPPTAAAVMTRLLEHLMAELCGERATDEQQRFAALGGDQVTFAIAGEPATGPCYLRLHGPHFVAEWLRLGDGRVFRRWRDFVRDAAEPWLRDEVRRATAGG